MHCLSLYTINIKQQAQSGCADHSTTTVTNKRQEEQFQIEHIQTDVLQRAQAAENSIKDLKKAVNTIKTSAKTTLDQTEKMFAELIRSAERKRSEIREIIKATEEAEVHRAEKILHGLEQEVTELKERDKKLVQLSNLEDDFLFVKTSMSLFNLSKFSDAPKFTVNLTPFKEIQNSVSELEIKCKEFCMSELSPGSTAAVNRCHMIQASVPIFREDFHQRLWVSDDSSVKLFGKIEKVHECIPKWTEVKHVTQHHPDFCHTTHSVLQVSYDAPDSPQAGVFEVQVFVPSKNLRIPLSVKSTDTAATLIKKCLEQRPDLGETLNLAYNGKPVSPCHDTTTVTKKRYQEQFLQFQIEHIQTDVLQRAQAAENSIKDLKKALNTIKISAKTALDQTEKLFAELIRSAERKRSEIKGIIKATEEAEVHRAEKILHFLEQELTELKERDKKLVQLSNLEDDFLFVKTSMSLFNLATFSDAPQFTVNLTPFKEIQNSVSELEIKCKEFCMSELSPGSRAAVNRCHMIQASVPIFREDFLQYFQQLTVDTRTSHRDLQLSEGNRNITFDNSKPYTQKPESFNYYSQTLCREALQKRCYWEVEWGGQQVYIAASYRGVERKGCFTSIGFGFNDKSWSLRCNSSQFTFFHDSYKKVISGPVSRRIGIYLDHRAGTLSFYSITDTMKLLHRVRTYFTEPLYGGFWVFDDSSVKICGKNEKLPSQTQITPVSASSHGYQFQFEE
ncbi:hypothetical protein HF521_015394 [Silurus meridionalis]|uniref:B30.2/SPRY domain-containing protein n=1 Tax=Silurus meridionalis TaxID=175797 RepID=A0A8T0A984_SILME|nr:hypothetical protein HF521_015394 [Silurus meridionalis]